MHIAFSHGNSTQGAVGSHSQKRYTAPTMFKGKRPRRGEPQSKPTTYTRDILCLPMDYEGRNGTVAIPRSLHRSRLANQETGLLGKFQFNLDWSPERMQREISSLFSKPFGLTEEDLAAGKTFKFDYLQRTGAGS